MAPSDRFKPVQRVVASRERKAARALGDARRRQHEQETRLAELRRYQQDYLAQFQAAARQGISAGRLQAYRAFIAKLDDAIRAQQEVVERVRHESADRRQEWREKHLRTRVMDNAVDRMKAVERQDAARLEQKDSDEKGQRRR